MGDGGRHGFELASRLCPVFAEVEWSDVVFELSAKGLKRHFLAHPLDLVLEHDVAFGKFGLLLADRESEVAELDTFVFEQRLDLSAVEGLLDVDRLEFNQTLGCEFVDVVLCEAEAALAAIDFVGTVDVEFGVGQFTVLEAAGGLPGALLPLLTLAVQLDCALDVYVEFAELCVHILALLPDQLVVPLLVEGLLRFIEPEVHPFLGFAHCLREFFLARERAFGLECSQQASNHKEGCKHRQHLPQHHGIH
mmetsp:Transcript_36625/g.79774  ORF Transcript_36625/g.79774 Transcript_36625/m.79774 type:complete len:250 (-) Transcript_36625:485-1234(-)